MLAWIAIIVSFIGIIGVGIGSYLAWRNTESTDASQWAFIISLGGLITFFIGWLFFLIYLFFSKGLDLNREAFGQLGSIIPDPNVIREKIIEGTDDKFADFVGM